MTRDNSFTGAGPAGRDAALRAARGAAIEAMRAGRPAEALARLAADGGAALRTSVGQNVRGDIFLKAGKSHEALKAFDAAIRLAPSAPEAH
mgnify:CR=1 FL=1